MASRIPVVLLVLIAAVATPRDAGAQFTGLAEVLERVTDVEVYVSREWTKGGASARPRRGRGASGLGVEVLFGVGAATRPDARGRMLNDSTPARDTTAVFEVAFGYGQSGGYTGRAAAGADPSADLYASLREVPAVTIYASLVEPPRLATALLLGGSPYVGLRTGYLTIQSGRSYTAEAVHELRGETFELAGAGGVAWTVGHSGITAFAEGAYSWRTFPSVEWSLPSGGALPASLPRSLDFTGPSASVGVQIGIK
jgi:hypothetical protein